MAILKSTSVTGRTSETGYGAPFFHLENGRCHVRCSSIRRRGDSKSVGSTRTQT